VSWLLSGLHQCRALADRHRFDLVPLTKPLTAGRAVAVRPDFLWQTTLGDLYCECKQLNMWQRTETQRASTLMSRAAEVMGDPQLWPKDVRMEILIHGNFKGESETRLNEIVHQQASEVLRGLRPSPFQAQEATT
jgi:hypothetical protein